MTADVWVKENDSAPQIVRTLLDGDGNPVNIEGASVRFIMGPLLGGTPVIEDDASNDQVDTGTDGSMGTVSYGWETSPGPGGYRAEFEVTFAGGSAIETFPNSGYLYVAVLDDLDEASSS